MGLPWWLRGKESACSAGEAGDTGSISGSEDPLEEGMATHSSVLAWRVPGTGAWQATVHGVAKSWTQLKGLSTHTGRIQGFPVVLVVKNPPTKADM